jgi:hypothetical protein
MNTTTDNDNGLYSYWNDLLVVTAYMSSIFGLSIAIF